MKKRFIIGLVMVTVATTIFVGCGSNTNDKEEKTKVEETVSEGVKITNTIDGKDYEVNFDKVPERAVSLSSFTTEMMLALGLEDKMVGTAYQDNEISPEYKEAYSKIESLSKDNVPKEKMVAVKPDFLTGWASDFKGDNIYTVDFCKEYGVKAYVPKTEYENITMEQVYEDFNNLGKIFKVEEKATEIITSMKGDIKEVNEKIKDKEKKKVFVWESGTESPYTPFTALPSHLVSLAGGENIFGDETKAWGSVTLEEIVKRNPEYIVMLEYETHTPLKERMDYIKNNKALQQVDAIKNNNIIVIKAADVLPGTRNVKAVTEMAKSFHKDSFK